MSGRALLLGAPDLAIEPALVAASAQSDLHIVRRARDAAELLAAAAVEPQLAAAVSAGLPRLSPDIVARLQHGRLLIGLASGDSDALQLRGLGLATIIQVRSADQALADLGATLSGMPLTVPPGSQGVWATGAWAVADEAEPTHTQNTTRGHLPCAGRIIALWGPPGAPGRTTTSVLLARLLARERSSVCIVDADTSAPSLLPLFDVAEHASSLVVACRFQERGLLSATRLGQLAIPLLSGVHGLGGISRAQQWSDVRAVELEAVLTTAREVFDYTIVDLGAGLEPQADQDILRSARYGAATSVIAGADGLLVVARASSIGLMRLLQQLPEVLPLAADNVTIALTPSLDRERPAQARRSLQEYGLHLPSLSLPRLSTEEVIRRELACRRPWRREPMGLPALRSWAMGLRSWADCRSGRGQHHDRRADVGEAVDLGCSLL